MFVGDNKDNFRELQQALPDGSNSIRKFEQKLAIDQNTLNHQILLYHDKMRSKFQQTQAMEIEGYLWKKGSGITKSWQRRYFICKKHELAYYHTAADSNTPRGALPLLLTSVKPVQDPERRFCFTVISQGKLIFFKHFLNGIWMNGLQLLVIIFNIYLIIMETVMLIMK